MKKAFRLLIVLCMLTACSTSPKPLQQDLNLGLDVSKIKYSELVFRAYHSDTKDHCWELLKEFHYEYKEDGYGDVKVLPYEGYIQVELYDNTSEQKEDTLYINRECIDSVRYDYDGFDGFFFSYKNFEVFDQDGEQFYELYPISNYSQYPYYSQYDLKKPYDNGSALDTIIITVEIVK